MANEEGVVVAQVVAQAEVEVDLEAALEKLTPEQLGKFEFIINEDGSVTFVDFPAELMDLAYALNPDDPLVCERRNRRGD